MTAYLLAQDRAMTRAIASSVRPTSATCTYSDATSSVARYAAASWCVAYRSSFTKRMIEEEIVCCDFCRSGCPLDSSSDHKVFIAEHNVYGMEITTGCRCGYERLVDVFEGPCAVCELSMGRELAIQWRDRIGRWKRNQERQSPLPF